MHYYIDGYNLMFRYKVSDENFTQQRQNIIEELNAKANILQLNLTIVFDGQHQEGFSTRSHYDQIEILFSSKGETADDLILSRVQEEKNPMQVTVVTSDKKLAWFARRCSAKTESVRQFLVWINRREKNKLRQRSIVKASKQVEEKKRPSRTQPGINASVMECFNYYLETFQKRLDELP